MRKLLKERQVQGTGGINSRPDAGLEIHLREGMAIFVLQRALPFENLKVKGKIVYGHQGQDQATEAVAFVLFQGWISQRVKTSLTLK